jgi:hypothetical protein
VIVLNTAATSYVGMTSSCAASAAAKRKEDKCAKMYRTHHFFPISTVAFGPVNHVGTDFISSLGHLETKNSSSLYLVLCL